MILTHGAPKRAHVVTLGCCIIGFTLGIMLLDARSLWGDEAFSVWASKQPVLLLLGGLDAQPPLYHLLLAASRALYGESVFAIRFLSLTCGVLLIAVGARLARRMSCPSASIFVALVLATSPILIYFEQEARMYTPAALFAAGAMLYAYLMQNPRARNQERSSIRVLGPLIAYLFLSVAALFTHFYTVGVLIGNTIALGVAALRSRNPRRMVEWAAAHGLIALVFGGWFFGLQAHYVSGSAATHSRIVPQFDEIMANFGRGIEGLVFGMHADGSTQVIALVLFVLALCGLIGYWRAHRRAETGLIGGWIVLSLGLVLLTAGKTGIVSDFSPRYFLFALLPMALALGGAALKNSRETAFRARIPLGPLAPLLIYSFALIPALIGNLQLLDTHWQKSRYQALASVIAARGKAGDAVVLVNSDQFPLMDYYGPKNLPAWIVDNNVLNGNTRVLTAKFDALTRDARRVWLVNYGWAMSLSSRSPIEQLLNAKGPRIYAQGFQDVSLALYDLRATGEDTPITPKDVDFDGQIKLTGVRERAVRYQPGDAIPLDLIWQAEQKPKAGYTVFMHLRRVSDGGQIAAFDSAPMNGATEK